MALSRRSPRTGRSRFTLLLLVLTSVTVLTLDFRGSGVVDDARGGAATVFGPVRDAAAWVGRPFADAWNGVFGYGDLESENERLRQRIDDLEGQAAQAEEAIRQIEEIDRLERRHRFTDLPTILARVTADSSLSNFQHTVEIDRGTDDGVAEGMPVVTGAGLVGRVVQVTASRSVVQLLSDPNFVAGIRLSRSGKVGIGHGTGDGLPFVVDEGVTLDIDVNENEVVSTSGVGRSVFPGDIPIGRVTSVAPAADQLSQVIEVDILADLDDLTFVRVLQWTPPA
jgi:rod shape-determining protein MreC